MDPRYDVSTFDNIFERRKTEWNDSEILNHVTNLFKKLELNEKYFSSVPSIN